MKSENFMLLYRVHLLFINELWYKLHSVITAQNLRRFRGERKKASRSSLWRYFKDWWIEKPLISILWLTFLSSSHWKYSLATDRLRNTFWIIVKWRSKNRLRHIDAWDMLPWINKPIKIYCRQSRSDALNRLPRNVSKFPSPSLSAFQNKMIRP